MSLKAVLKYRTETAVSRLIRFKRIACLCFVCLQCFSKLVPRCPAFVIKFLDDSFTSECAQLSLNGIIVIVRILCCNKWTCISDLVLNYVLWVFLYWSNYFIY